MTIAHQFLGKKVNKQQEEPLVPNEKPPSIKDAEEGKPVVVTMHAHVRRVSSMTTLCVFVTSLLVCSTGIIGGVYLYKQFSHYKLRHFHGFCNVPYNREKQDLPKKAAMVKDNVAEASEVAKAWQPATTPKEYFEEEVDIDIKFGKYERIDVPAFTHGRKSHFIHDFVVNKTAVADYENKRCFVMVLNHQYVLPPRRLYEIVSKMRTGYYDADTQIVRQTMRVVTPRISDLRNVGLVIARDCASMPIYMMERATSPVFKRSLNDDSKNLFVGFAGNKITEYKIYNIQDATPGDSS